VLNASLNIDPNSSSRVISECALSFQRSSDT